MRIDSTICPERWPEGPGAAAPALSGLDVIETPRAAGAIANFLRLLFVWAVGLGFILPLAVVILISAAAFWISFAIMMTVIDMAWSRNIIRPSLPPELFAKSGPEQGDADCYIADPYDLPQSPDRASHPAPLLAAPTLAAAVFASSVPSVPAQVTRIRAAMVARG